MPELSRRGVQRGPVRLYALPLEISSSLLTIYDHPREPSQRTRHAHIARFRTHRHHLPHNSEQENDRISGYESQEAPGFGGGAMVTVNSLMVEPSSG